MKWTCPDCEASSPTYEHKSNLTRAITLHTCGEACPECKFFAVSQARRGLCKRCYSNREIREQYPILRPSWKDLIEDLTFMDEQGIGIVEACKRLGKPRETVRRALDRTDRLDLYWKMAKREPDYELRAKNRKVA